MAIAVLETNLGITGLTLTVDLYPLGSDTAAATGIALTEATNRKGTYTGTTVAALTGKHHAKVKSGTAVIVDGFVVMDDTTNTHRIVENDPAISDVGATRKNSNLETVLNASQTAGDIIGDTNDIQASLALQILATGTVVDNGANTTLQFDTTLTDAANNYRDTTVQFLTGSLTKEIRPIQTFGVAAVGRIVTDEAYNAIPAAGDTFQIVREHTHAITTLANQVNSTLSTSHGIGGWTTATGFATSAALSTLQTDVTTLLSRITSTLFSGITSLAQWLGLMAGKQTGNSTARTEIRATGAGSGTFDETVDSMEATRDALPVRIQKNTALVGFPFFMADSSDHVSGKTGLTITATRSLDGAAFAACANAATEIANGWYKIDLAATDVNGNTVALKFTATGADQRNLSFATQV